MTVKKRIICALFLIFITALASCGQNPPAAAPTLNVPVALQPDSSLVTRGTVESLMILPGLTRLQTEAARLEYGSGRLGAIYVWPGDSVVQGQVLASLETPHLQAQIENLEELIRRTRALFQKQSNEIALQIEYLELAYAQNPYQGTRERIEWLRLDASQLQTRHMFDIAELEAALADLTENINNMVIRAPIDGEIVYTMRYGSWINTNDAVMHIARPGEVFVEYVGLAIDRRITREVHVQGIIGDRAFDLELKPVTLEEQFYGRRHGIAPSMRFEILAEPDEKPTYGELVFIRFYTARAEDVLRIPGNALFRAWPYDDHVYRIEDGRQVRVYVITGIITESFVEIMEGLNEGDRVFVRP